LDIGCPEDCGAKGDPCDDGIGCTKDGAAGGGCEHVPNDALCTDANACTTDLCDLVKGCVHIANAVPCDDGNACTKLDACKSGQCQGSAIACDDGNPCTTDACDPASGCVNAPNAAACDDGSACTTGDACKAGLCAGTPLACDDANACTADSCDPKIGCKHKAVTVFCDDGNACTQADTCKAGVCTGAAVDCNDGNTCTADACDPVAGCTHAPADATCDDADACTLGDACAGGVCAGAVATVCDDGNPCTDDSCEKSKGCVYLPNAATCDDGSACTALDACASGLCQGVLVDCDDDNPCTDDGCGPKTGCTHAIVGGGCEDGDLCTKGDLCVAGVCVGKPLDCADASPCTQDGCDPAAGACVHAPMLEGPCDDGDPCTVDLGCQFGACVTKKKDCSDDLPCSWDVCAPDGTCVHEDWPSGVPGPCDDGDPCTSGDHCAGKACSAAIKPCDDKNVCTVDACDPTTGACSHLPAPGTCDDGNPCTTGDVCSGLSCVSTQATCDDGDPCTKDLCDAKTGACATSPLTGNECDDADVCTSYDTCASGTCVGKPVCQCQKDADCASLDDGDPCNGKVLCNAQHQCKLDASTIVVCPAGQSGACSEPLCNPSTGLCEETVKADGASCNDGNACTVKDLCVIGACKGITANCNDNNPCTKDSCVPASGCVNAPAAGPCNDNDACTWGDACDAGACKGEPVSCDDGKVCTTDSCDKSIGCAHQANYNTCEDGDLCTFEDHCASGVCQPGGSGWIYCDDKDPCTTDSCDSNIGCVHVSFSGSCDDGDWCTWSDACTTGKCKGDPRSCADPDACTLDACDGKAFKCTHTFTDACPLDGWIWPANFEHTDANYVVDVAAGTVLDKTTQLMWQREGKTAYGDVQGSTMVCDVLVQGGYSDWRLPMVHELLSLVRTPIVIGQANVNLNAFPTWNTAKWLAGSPLKGYAGLYWGVDVRLPQTDSANNLGAGGLCVRGGLGGQPDQFVTVEAQVVKGTRSGLMWSVPTVAVTSPAQAESVCTAMTQQGGGWRVPSPIELMTIVRLRAASPAIDTLAFPATASAYYVTNASYISGGTSFAVVDFATGQLTMAASFPTKLRCVK